MSTVVAPELKELDLALKQLTWSEFTSFALQLGMENHTLRKIGQQGIGGRKRSAMQHWLNNDLEASWEKIVRCLEVIDMKVLADGLRKKYCAEATVETSTLLKSS